MKHLIVEIKTLLNHNLSGSVIEEEVIQPKINKITTSETGNLMFKGLYTNKGTETQFPSLDYIK